MFIASLFSKGVYTLKYSGSASKFSYGQLTLFDNGVLSFLSATSVHKIKPSSFPRLLLTGTCQVIAIKENYDLRIAFGYANSEAHSLNLTLGNGYIY